MWDMFFNSMKLFFKGKLFRSPAMAFRQGFIGFFVALVGLFILAKWVLPLWLSVFIVAIVVGLLQPWLFKDLKFD